MATYTVYDSNQDEIASNDINALFDTLSLSQQQTETVKNRKLYLDSDETLICYLYISDKGYFDSAIFISASDSDVEGDLLGTEDKFGIIDVLSGTINSFTFDNTLSDYDFFRVGETIIVGGANYVIDTVTDNLDGTTTVESTIDFLTVPTIGDKISSAIELSLTANIKKSIWRINRYDPASNQNDRYNTVTLKILD